MTTGSFLVYLDRYDTTQFFAKNVEYVRHGGSRTGTDIVYFASRNVAREESTQGTRNVTDVDVVAPRGEIAQPKWTGVA